MHCAIQSYCKSISRPVFYVNSPEDLICSAPKPVRVGESLEGTIQDQGGPLYDFLIEEYSPHNPPIIIVDYRKFKADDVVRFNDLLAKVKERKADGIPLPESAVVWGY